MRSPSEWPAQNRFTVAGITGVVWALLLVGLIGLDTDALVFLAASALLAAPILGILARDVVDLATFYLISFAVSFASITFIAISLSSRHLFTLQYGELFELVAFNWIPAWLMGPLVFWLAHRQRRKIKGDESA